MKKRVLSVLLAFALVVGSLPAQVFATDEADAAAQQVTTVTQAEESDTQDTESDTQNVEDGMQDAESGTQNAEDDMQASESDTQNTESGMQDAESDAQNTESGTQDAESNAQDVEDDTQGVQNNINIQDDRQSNGLNNVQEEPQSVPQPAMLNTGSFTYLDTNGEEQTYSGSYTELTGTYYYDEGNLTEGWYLVKGTTSYPMTSITISGNVTLVLADGAELKCYKALELTAGASLTITAQSDDRAGSFRITNTEGSALSVASGATLTINGGNLELDGNGYSSGGGNGIFCTGDVIINGGSVEATGNGGAGIGGTGNITINDGSVEAAGHGNGPDQGTAGIDCGKVTITGGTVTAWGDKTDDYFPYMQAIAGNQITISGGVVTANDGSGAIGSFGNCHTGDHGSALIYASSFEAYDANASYILFERYYGLYDSIGEVHGNVKLDKDLILEKGTQISVGYSASLTVPAGVTLTVEAGAGLANNGTITNDGTIWVKDGASYTGNGSLNGKITCNISYIDENGEVQQTTCPVGLVNGSTATLNDGWYLVQGTVNAANGLTVTGDVTLVLADGAALSLNGVCLTVNQGSSLTITAQSKGDEMGSLTVSYPYDPNKPLGCCGIGGANSTVTIWGGKVTATADTIGIGGNNSTVTIRGGVVSATSIRTDYTLNYAIGGDESSVTISGGKVTANGSNFNGFDIGCSQMSTAKPDGSNGNAMLCAGSFSMPTSLESLDYISVNQNGSPERIYGEVTLGENLTIAEGQTLTITAGTKLIVPTDIALTNDGTITVEVGGRYVGEETSPNPVSYERVNYLDEKGETQTKRADEVTVADSSTTELNDKDGGWYLVRGTTYWKNRVTVTGDVNLILADRVTLEALEGIEVNSGSSLTITAQSNGSNMGKLIATGADLCAGIGGNGEQFDGSIIINGGRITASAKNGAGIGGIAQIGDKSKSSEGSITINGGIVNATGGNWAAGIGIGGNNGSKVTITINGGEVTATGGSDGGAGIGTRENSSNGFEITITGGTVQATGQYGGAGIGTGRGAHSDSLPGSIKISGGIVTALSGGEGAAAIGDGDNPTGTSFSTGEDGNAVIYAASITGSEDTTGWSCIWFENETGDGRVYGSIALSDDMTIANGQTLTIEPGAMLTVPENLILTNNGSIKVELNGEYNGNQPVNNKVTYWIGWDANDDGTAEESGYLPYGETPAYSGEEPAKKADAQYTYTFRDWDPKVVTVTESKMYTAQFTGTLNRYTVTLPESPVGYTLTPNSGTTLDYGTDFTFTLTLEEGYSAAPDFAVKANGQALTATNNLYTITVKGNTTITVEGVKDLTAPDTTLTVAENSFKEFLNQITFGLFFKEDIEVTLSATDAGSGIKELYYLRSESPLNQEELKNAAWQIYTSPITETAQDAAQFVYYGKAVDETGNVMLVSSEGVVFDTTAPTFAGALPDSVYYTTQQVTVNDANLDTITLDGVPVTSPVTLRGDTDVEYNLVAADKAGNKATLTVTMKPIEALALPETSTSADKSALEALQQTVETLLKGEHLTDEEREKLENRKDEIAGALDLIEGAEAAQESAAESVSKVEHITQDNVRPENKEDLNAAKENLENALNNFGGNYTDAESEEMKEALQQVNAALESLERVESAQEAINGLPDTVEPDDLETVEKIEAAKEQFDQLTDHEKELLGNAADNKLEALLDATRAYRILSGEGSSWTKGNAKGQIIVANGAPERLVDLLLDGNSIDKAQFTIQKGSTIVTLKPAYLDTLAVGAHTLTFVYENGKITANFIIAAVQDQSQVGETDTGAVSQSQPQTSKVETGGVASPQTGDTSNLVLWELLAVLCVVALIGIFVWKQRKKTD